MGADSEKKASHGTWQEDGYVPCPESEYPKWPARSPGDRAPASKIEAMQEVYYPSPSKVEPGSVPKTTGTV